MKITRTQLKQIIREEISRVSRMNEAFKIGDKVQAKVGQGKIIYGKYAGRRKDVDGKDTHSIKQSNGEITLHPKIEKSYEENINEVTVTSIPNFNMESDAYIAMLDLLKTNTAFKKIVSKVGKDYYTGGNPKSLFAVLHSGLKHIINSKLVLAVQGVINSKRRRLDITPQQAGDAATIHKFAGLLALGVLSDLKDDPNGFPKVIGDPVLIKAGSEFSSNRGKEKMGVMMGNIKEATTPWLTRGYKKSVGFTTIRFKADTNQLIISHNGNMGNSITGSVDPNLKVAGIPSIATLKRKYPSFKESGSPDSSYGITFKIS